MGKRTQTAEGNKPAGQLSWLDRNRVSLHEIVPDVTDISDYEMQQIENRSRKLSSLLRSAAQESVQNNLDEIRNELEDQDISSASILGIYDLAFLGMNVLPKKLIEDSATLRAIIEAACAEYPELAIQEQTDIFSGNLPAILDKARAIHIPSEHLVTHSKFMDKALSGNAEFIMRMKLLDKAQKPIRYHYTLTEENPNISKTDDPEYNRLLFETIGDLMYAGNEVLTQDTLCRIMLGIDGSDQPSKQQKERADKAMDYWNQTLIDIKREDDDGKMELRGHALEFHRIYVSSGGQDNVLAYQMLSVPIFIIQAKASGQIDTVDGSLLEITDATGRKRLRLTTERLNARTYLIRRISAMMRMKKTGQTYSGRISFDSIINAMRPGKKYADLQKAQRSRSMQFVYACLDHFIKRGWIPSYSEDRSKKNPSIVIDLF